MEEFNLILKGLDKEAIYVRSCQKVWSLAWSLLKQRRWWAKISGTWIPILKVVPRTILSKAYQTNFGLGTCKILGPSKTIMILGNAVCTSVKVTSVPPIVNAETSRCIWLWCGLELSRDQPQHANWDKEYESLAMYSRITKVFASNVTQQRCKLQKKSISTDRCLDIKGNEINISWIHKPIKEVKFQ